MNKKILIVDDMEINRVLLAEAFKDYDIVEASDGVEALEHINGGEDIAAVLLDLIMPGMGGIDVLRDMNRSGIINHIPVFIITAENEQKLLMDAYELGAVDVVTKPFMMNFLHSRIQNIIELFSQRNDLEAIVQQQVEKLSSLNRSMVELLATVIEFRDCESGEHVKRICGLTDILMTCVSKNYPEYYMSRAEIDKIVTASVLHDVGKISIPDSILNKPGRLTPEEFEQMKLHTVKGCEILSQMSNLLDDDLYNYSYDICRHHHERWDGRGYPDGLKGDNISIWAQVVSVADVYDALVSPRCYKKAFPHEVAMKMITNGECGVFNPKIMAAFLECEEQIKERYIEIGEEAAAGA